MFLSAALCSVGLATEKDEIGSVNVPGASVSGYSYDGNNSGSPHDAQVTATDGANRATVNADVEGNNATAGAGVRDADGITAVRTNISPGNVLGGL